MNACVKIDSGSFTDYPFSNYPLSMTSTEHTPHYKTSIFFHLTLSVLFSKRWADHTANIPVAPDPSLSYAATFLGSSAGMGEPPPAYLDESRQALDVTATASYVHSPGWPSPRGTSDVLMQLPLKISKAHLVTEFLMPPTPPTGGSTGTHLLPDGEVLGVAWLAAETVSDPGTGEDSVTGSTGESWKIYVPRGHYFGLGTTVSEHMLVYLHHINAS